MVNTLIDVEANAVAAQTPVARRYKGPRHWAFFRDEPDRVVITFECKSGVRKVRFHARTLRDSKNLVKVAETALRSFKYEDKSVKESPYAKQSSLAPIASPTGPVGTPQIGRPEYGRILPIKFGKMILAMSPMGLMNPAPAVVFTAAAWITLRDYGPNDPGDRHLVRLGLIIGIVEVVLWAVALIWLHRFGYI